MTFKMAINDSFTSKDVFKQFHTRMNKDIFGNMEIYISISSAITGLEFVPLAT